MTPVPARKGAPHATGPAPPKKSLGQNFLMDRRVRSRIVQAADLSPDDLVVEVGPGRGFLTRLLVERAGGVVAVEMDEALAGRLRESFADRSDLTVVAADAREVDIVSLVGGSASYKLVANLPYYAASPIIRRFLEASRKPTLMVVMVQREVAQTMTAPPGKMGLLSVATQLYGRPRIVCHAPPRAFRPAPKVTSSVVRIDVFVEPAIALDSRERFFDLVRAGFSAPRKQLRNSLTNRLDISPQQAAAMLTGAGIDPTRRAQTLDLVEWAALYETYGAYAFPSPA